MRESTAQPLGIPSRPNRPHGIMQSYQFVHMFLGFYVLMESPSKLVALEIKLYGFAVHCRACTWSSNLLPHQLLLSRPPPRSKEVLMQAVLAQDRSSARMVVGFVCKVWCHLDLTLLLLPQCLWAVHSERVVREP
jgi:hypothetical protein